MTGYRTTGLFAGIAGLESGFAEAGHEAIAFCENDPGARAVLRHHFPDVPVFEDVRTMETLPTGTELVTAGFPCQDLSQAGNTRGLAGERSGLVGEVFRLLRASDVPHVVLENVPFMLQLDAGQAIRWIVDQLEELGYAWAYRVVDSRAFGLPQRRQRVFLFASRTVAPANALFHDDAGNRQEPDYRGKACGFYWTEGVRGLGWAVNGIPTLKGGSTIGIPSPPAIWLPDGRIVKPDIRDGERLQGFPADWTRPAEEAVKRSLRWKLVGNAVSVPTARWLGRCLLAPGNQPCHIPMPFDQHRTWPKSAYGCDGKRFEINVSMWPQATRIPPLEKFLDYPPELLSIKAVTGFVRRLESGSLHYPPEFRHALIEHLSHMERRETTLAN